MSVKIYHNPRCSKSRQTLALLNERGIEPEIIEYLETPPDAGTVTDLCGKLGIEVRALMRTGEAEYKAAKAELEGLDDAALADWLADNPRVIERPIVVTAKGARIGRPPENVLEILE